MSELELVWILQCEVCGREHQQCESHDIQSLDQIESESKAFKQRCEEWYLAHVQVLQAGKLPAAMAE